MAFALHRHGPADVDGWLALATDPEATPEALADLVSRAKREPRVQGALAANPRTPPPALRRLGRVDRWDVRALVAANPSTDARTLDQLACDESWAVGVALASRPDLPPRVLEGAGHWTAHERFALAGNPEVPVEILERLLDDHDVYVRGRAAANPRARPESLRALVQAMTEPPWVLRAVAANPACPPDLADELFTWIALGGTGAGDPTFDPVACVGNPTDAQVPEFFFYQQEATRPDAHESVLARVRASIPTANDQIKVRVLEVLARDGDASVRRAAARFAELPRDVLEELTQDADDLVVRTARPSLDRQRAAAQGRRRATTWRSVTRSGVPALLALVAISAVNGIGGGGGNSSTPIPAEAVRDLLDERPPTVAVDTDVVPPPTETRLSGGARVRTGYTDNRAAVRMWFDTGSQPLEVLGLDVKTTFGSKFSLVGFSLPAGVSHRIKASSVSLSRISSITVRTPEGHTEIRMDALMRAPVVSRTMKEPLR